MNPAPNREVALFSVALELPASQRAAYLDGACADDPALRLRLEALLRVHEEAIPFLETPAAGAQEPPMGAEVPDATVRLSSSPAEKAGDRIGRYKLLQQIGEGGCGVVYMAEQEEPVRRRIALKVIKLGMDTKQVVARFEAERQALALMDHPNIAKVFDAGATETGRPFFVMELVKGIPITRYCDENCLSTEQRLRLFVQACQAIQHAHQKGIIHRDIKPSNILVADHDGVPVPKIIDFGIAKATTDQRLTDKTLFTAFEQFMGTPAYMSPEQAKLSGLDIDTRSDIYSLGVLLYELLTGSTPFDSKALMQAGLDEIRRTIREQEPDRPSTRLSTMAAANLTEVAKQRNTEPAKLGSLIRGDLDWIVMKALEKDRARRYETANGLATDIQRHLNCEPVVARPPSRLYEFQKSIQRHKLGFAAAAALITVLTLGVVVSTVEAIRATRAEREQSRLREEAQQAQTTEAKLRLKAQSNEERAETEAARSAQVARLLQDMLKGVGPAVALGRDTKLLREVLDRTAERVSKDLTNQPSVEAELRTTIGEAYYAIGEHDKAKTMLRRAVELRKQVPASGQVGLAISMKGLARVLWRQGQFAEAETLARDALAIERTAPGDQHLGVADSLKILGTVLNSKNDLAGAEELLREALDIRRKLLGEEHLDVAEALGDLSAVLQRQGKVVEAETMMRETLATEKKLLGSEHPSLAGALNGLGNVLRQEGKLVEAESVLRDALKMRRNLLPQGHPDLIQSLNNLGKVLEAEGKLDDAEALYQEVLTIRRTLLGADHMDVAASLTSLAAAVRKQGRLKQAEDLYREALAMARKLTGNESRAVGNSLGQLADFLRDEGKLAEAESVAREELAVERALSGPQSAMVASSLLRVALVLQDEGKLGEADKVCREELALVRKLPGDQNSKVAQSLRLLTAILYRQGKQAEGEPLLHETIALYEKAITNSPNNDGLKWSLVELRRGQGKLAEAERVLREALAQQRKMVGSEHLEVATSLSSLSFLFRDEGKLHEAEATAREALAIRKKLLGNQHSEVAQSLHLLAWNLNLQDKHTEAEALSREELAMWRKLLGNDDPNVAWALGDLTIFLRDQGKKAEAEKASREAMEIILKPGNRDLARLPQVARQLAEVLKSQGKSQDAEKHFEDAIKGAHQKLGETNLISGQLLHDYGDFLFYQENKPGAAAVQYLKSLPIRRIAQDDNLVWTLRNLGGAQHLAAGPKEAEPHFRESLKLYHLLHQKEDLWESVSSAIELADTLYQQHKLPEAEQAYRDALAACTKCQALGSDDCSRAVRSLLDVLKEENKLADGETLCREILLQQRAAFTNGSPAVAQTLSTLADNLALQGKQTEAEAALREALRMCQQSAGLNTSRSDDRAKLGHLQWQLAQMLADRQKPAEAEQLFLEAFQVFEKASKDFRHEPFMRQEQAYTAWMLAGMLEGAARLDAAEAEYRRAITLHQKASADFPNEAVFTERLGTLNVRLVELLCRRGKLAEAKSMYREVGERGSAPELNQLAWSLATSPDPTLRDGTNAVLFAEKAVAATHRKSAGYLDTLAAAYAETGQSAKAVSVQREAIALSQSEQEKKDLASKLTFYENKIPYRDHGALAEFTRDRLVQGKFAEAEGPARECLTLREREIPDDWRTFNARSMLGGSLLGQKKYAEAEPLLLSGYEGMKQREEKIPLEGKARLTETLQRLVQLYEATNRPEQAAGWKRKLGEFAKTEK